MTLKRAASGAALLTASRLIARGLDFATLLLLARLLTPADVGLISVAMTVIIIVEAVLQLPVGLVLVRLPKVEQDDVDTAFTLACIRALATAGVVLALSLPMSTFFGDPRLLELIAVLGLAPVCRGLVSPGISLCVRDFNFKPDAMLMVLGKLVMLIITLAVALLTGSYWALAAGTIAAPAAMMLTSYFIAPCQPRLCLRNWRPFVEFLGWSSAAQLAATVSWQCDRLLLGRFVSPALVGKFAIATDISFMPWQAVIVPAQQAMLPSLAASGRDAATHRSTYSMATMAITAVFLPVSVGLAVLSDPLVHLVLGETWRPAAPILFWMALATIPELLVALMPPVAMVMNRTRVLFHRNLAELSIKLPLTALAAALYGVEGVVAVRLASSAGMCLVSMVLVRRLIALPIRRQLTASWRTFASVGLMACLLLALRSMLPPAPSLFFAMELAAIILAGALTYAVALCALWILSGRPDGFESKIIGRFYKYIARGGRLLFQF